MNYMKNKIDFVIPWVDGNDPGWQKEKQTYDTTQGDKKDIRFRDWENLQYWFRGVEKFSPWVNKIHFVTWGHLPEWLNTKHPKLNIVKHTDFLKKENLPVFNSCAIEVNLHRIPGLSEKFVYFNDDTFLTNHVKENDFFKKGLPRDEAIPNPTPSVSRIGVGCAISNNMEIINTTFNKRSSMSKNIFKWFHPLYKHKNIASFCLLPWPKFSGFATTHLPLAYLKGTFQEVWEQEELILSETSKSKFRSKNDVNQWIMRYWQLVSGNFIPRNINFGKSFMLEDNNEKALTAIKKQKFKMICLNDTVKIKNPNNVKNSMINAFEEILPNKSLFEK